MIALTLAIAWASTVFLENPVRSHPGFKGRIGRTFALGAILSALVLVASLALAGWVSMTTARDAAAVEASREAKAMCFGAGAMDPEHDCARDDELVTSPEFAKEDRPEGITTCLNWPPFGDLISCSRGNVDDPDQEAGSRATPTPASGSRPSRSSRPENDWQLDTYIIGACLPISVQIPTAPPTAARPARSSRRRP